jgi:acetyltransferase-like isoleucine patch superfamily enzyme
VVIARGASVGAGARIEAVGGVVRLGPGARLGERAVVVSHAGVEIGPRAVVGGWAAVEGAAPTYDDPEAPVREQPLRRGPVTIGAGAVVGPHAVLGPGVVVPAGRVVEPYAVVSSS